MLTASAGMLSFSSIACRINISLFLLYFSFINYNETFSNTKHSQIPIDELLIRIAVVISK